MNKKKSILSFLSYLHSLAVLPLTSFSSRGHVIAATNQKRQRSRAVMSSHASDLLQRSRALLNYRKDRKAR